VAQPRRWYFPLILKPVKIKLVTELSVVARFYLLSKERRFEERDYACIPAPLGRWGLGTGAI